MSDGCPLWPDVQELRDNVRDLQAEQARLDARVHALEGRGPQEPATRPAEGSFAGWLRRMQQGRMPQEGRTP